MKSIPPDTVQNVLVLLTSGHSTRKIHQKTGISLGAISAIRAKHCPTLLKAPGGRPSKLSDVDICYAIRSISSGKAENAVQLRKSLQETTNQSISCQTVRRALKNTGLKAVVKKKKPFLKKKHIQDRLEFAKRHQHWTIDDWMKVIWSDETKINRLGSDGRIWVWKKPGEPLSDRLVEGTVKHGGGSVMVWGCMSWDGVGYATKIDGTMDGDLYISIMEDELQDSIEFWGKTKEDIIFQQDNDPKHTCKKARKWFQDHDLTVLQWPAQSPDLNPIEHLWQHLKRKLGEYETQPKGVLELWERVEKTWEEIPAEICQNLIQSMPNRIQAVLKAKGGHTKY
jgi:transposase